MSNRIYIDTEFCAPVEMFDVRVYDDHETVTMIVEKLPDDDLEMLDFLFTDVFNGSREFKDLMEFVLENDKSITIRDSLYTIDQTKSILEKHLEEV